MIIFKNRFWQYGLFPLSLVYRFVVWLRNRFYDKKILPSATIEGCQIISVGNISVGGTGKTPVIHFLAKYLIEQGFKVAILSRGYGRSSHGTIIVSDGHNLLANVAESGDEPFLLARQLPTTPVIVEVDRVRGAELIQRKFRPDFILLDDGFQHRRLQRNFDIVLIDASVGFGSGHLLPAGFLREPISSLSRADLIWLTHVDRANDLEHLVRIIRKLSSSPIITSIHQPTAIVDGSSNQKLMTNAIYNKRIFLFSGIANPGSFEQTVQDLGGFIVRHQRYSDHHRFKKADLDSILQQAEKYGVDLILTTEKDYVRMLPILYSNTKIYYLTIEIQLKGSMNTLNKALAPLFHIAMSKHDV